jgi:hypothetical protein
MSLKNAHDNIKKSIIRLYALKQKAKAKEKEKEKEKERLNYRGT